MRKVLSFVLVLALVLSSFSMAFAADAAAAGLTDIAGNANEDAIQVCYDLGIVTGNPDGTFLPEKAVNRAEFAAMLTRALDVPASALAGYTSTSFKDTVGYSWAVPYLAFCQSKGILLGDGAGNVMPGRTITVNEAMTMALRAIGYTANSSLLVGVWPSNYVSIAQNEDLYDDVANDITVNKASAAQIIYNLLTVQKVAVNTDGTTDKLWDGDPDDEVVANLLNTNLGCTANEDVILGSDGYGYDDAIINITKELGAYGTAYTNSDDEVVAFTKDSTILTGKLSDDETKFEVGDIDYNIDDDDNEFTTGAATFENGDYVDNNDDAITIAKIADFADDWSNDGSTVTLNVDLSGKTIKDIYSVVGWNAVDNNDLASSDVQEDIADQELLNNDFDTTDDDATDFNSFQLVGVASLDKIAEDNVLYVYYSDDDEVIRKVEVGTETVEGTVDEIDGDMGAPDTLTIGDKDYDVAALATDNVLDVDIDDEGTFYLDVNGEIYDFDGTTTPDTYGIVKTYQAEGVDNAKLKLYTSEDATKTYALSDSLDDIDWTSDDAIQEELLETTGSMIGYSLDSNGDIDSIDNTVVDVDLDASPSSISSSKVIKIDGISYTIDSAAVVMTYGTGYDDPTDVATPKDLETGTLEDDFQVIFNEDGDVIALYVQDDYATSVDDAIYGVINSRTYAKNDDGDKVYKFTGFIDGAAFTYKTVKTTDIDVFGAGNFSVYGFELDANDVIAKDMIDLSDIAYDPTDEDSGYLVLAAQIDSLNSDKTIITIDNDKYTVADDAVVYKYDVDDEEFTVSKLSSLRDEYYVSLFDTKGEDADGTASVVIFSEDAIVD